MRIWLRNWLTLRSDRELLDQNSALRQRINLLREALKEAGWRARMNGAIPDNRAAYNITVDALIRDLEHDQFPSALLLDLGRDRARSSSRESVQ